MQSVAPAPARHQAAGELVDDDDPAVLDHVLDVETEQRVRAQRLVHVVEQRHVRRVVEPVRPWHQPMRQHLLRLGHAGLGQRDRLVLLVDEVVAGRSRAASRSSALTLPWVTAPFFSLGMIRSTS